MTHKIKLIVGLGNPGSSHAMDRHNVGFWLLDVLANDYNASYKSESKFKSEITELNIANEQCRLVKPNTFMNCSGEAVAAIVKFYKYNPEEILVIHDELDLPIGSVKIKKGGGHGGHNGLRDIISRLSSKEFYRMRIGISHPGHKDKVSAYVLSKPKKDEQEEIIFAIQNGLKKIEDLVSGNIEKAILEMHTKSN